MSAGSGWRIALAAVVAAAFPSAAGADQELRAGIGLVRTVVGDIRPDRLGVTMMHEHLVSDISIPLDAPERWAKANRALPATVEARSFWLAPVTMHRIGRLLREEHGNRDNMRLDDPATAVREVVDYRRAGGGTLVDVTSGGIGRNPLALRRIARASGVTVVMGTGWYREAWYPAGFAARGVDDLAAEMVRDITVGVDGTGVRAGIIGELGAVNDRRGPLAPAAVRMLQAAAIAARRTGAAISLHTILHPGDRPEGVDILAAAGTDMRRVIVGHANAFLLDDAYLNRMIGRGVMIEFDMLGWPGAARPDELNDRQVARTVARLVRQGHGSQILLSQDTCRKTQLKRYGGNGYSYVLEAVVPELRRQGLSSADIKTILIDNPQRVLALAPSANDRSL